MLSSNTYNLMQGWDINAASVFIQGWDINAASVFILIKDGISMQQVFSSNTYNLMQQYI
jgi:hypothetical protein